MISVRMEGVEEARATMDHKKVERAARMALNDSARTARTEAGKELRKKWNITASRVNKELKNLSFARVGNLAAIIEAKGRPISLVHFGAKEVKSFRGGVRVTTGRQSKMMKRSSQARGVTVRIEKGKSTHLPNAFIATMRSGYTGVFQRWGTAGRLPVENKTSITIPSMYDQPKVQTATIRAAIKRWNERFQHHLDRFR